MATKSNDIYPKAGNSQKTAPLDKDQMITETISIIDALHPDERSDASLEAIYNLLQRPGGRNYDDFKFFFQRLTEFFFQPENSASFCKAWMKPEDVYTMIYDLDLFLEEVNFWVVANQVQKYELLVWGSDLTSEQVTNIHARYVEIKKIEEFKNSLK